MRAALPRLRAPRPTQVLSRAEQRLRGRALAALWAVGTVLTVASLVLPDKTIAEEPRLLLVAGVAVAFSAALWVGSGKLPRWTFDIALAGGTLLIAVLVNATGPTTSPYILLLVWQLVFAAYFLPAARAGAQALIASSALTVALLERRGDLPLVRWALALATFAVVTGLVAALRAHVDRLVAEVDLSARTDPLTGALNRRGFEEVLEAECLRAGRSGQPLSVVVCDVDHFKAINDAHGHAVGDRALQHVVAELRRTARAIDAVGRLGGEEFAILLPDTDASAAFQAAERMRVALHRADGPDALPLTASFGVSACHDGWSGLDRADAALYEAKAAGRDRTCTAPAV